jgi:plasmid stabilization system protein ParE
LSLAKLIVTPRAERDVEDAIADLGLPDDTWGRIGRSLRLLEDFPFAGRALEGKRAPARFLLGPWPWMILVYSYDESSDRVFLAAVHDARTATAATSKVDRQATHAGDRRG